MIEEDTEGLEPPPLWDIPPPPPPPWLEQDDPGCGACHQGQVSSYLGDTFYNIVIILVFVISMLIILFTLSMFLYRRFRRKSRKQQESVIMSDYQIENIPKLSYNFPAVNHQNYYTNMPMVAGPVYESVDPQHYSDLSSSLSVSTSSSASSQSRFSSRERRALSPHHEDRSSPQHPPVTEL